MMTLAPDKNALVKVGFSILDTVHLGPGQSAPRQKTRSGVFATPWKGRWNQHWLMRYDDAEQRLSDDFVPTPVSHSS
jgi:hypothetical protein